MLIGIISIIVIGFIPPQSLQMPVKGASKESYNQKSYWAYPWGKSVTHKGVDIFAKKSTTINSATYGIVIHTGQLSRGGNIVLILGPKWRFHYYAHLDKITTSRFAFVSKSTPIGTVGSTGNAVGKAPHLHYTIQSIFPYPWRKDESVQGWKKMFYLNPIEYLNEAL